MEQSNVIKYEFPRLIETISSGHISDLDVLNNMNEVIGTSKDNLIYKSIWELETDKKSIEEKQEIFKFLLYNSNGDNIWNIKNFMFDSLPLDYYSLKKYNENGTNFYNQVRTVKDILDDSEIQNSEKLKSCKQTLENILGLEDSEKSIIKDISDKAKKGHKYFGNFELIIYKDYNGNIKEKVTKSKGYGFRLYPLEEESVEYVGNAPTSIAQDIINHVTVDNYFELFNKIQLNINYVYNENGLKLNISCKPKSWNLNRRAENKIYEINLKHKDEFYNPHKKKTDPQNITEKTNFKKFIVDFIKQKKRNFEIKSIKNEIKNSEIDRIIGESHAIAHKLSTNVYCENSNNDFQNHLLENIFKEKSSELQNQNIARNEFKRLVSEILQYEDAVNFFKGVESKGYPICFPEICDYSDTRDISIIDMYPIRTFSKSNKPIPNNVSLNGTPQIITGPNTGGKSTYIISTADAITFTQAGFPIVAKSAKMSIKDAIFPHFIKSGDIKLGESTFESSLLRFKSLLENIPNYTNPHVVIDELAAGTDPQSANEISGLIINAFSDLRDKVSSCIVTQCVDVATNAEKNQLAETLMVNENHKVVPGIGKSKGVHLANKLGLNEEFFKSISTKN